MSFAALVWRYVRRIPRGRVTTYGAIATRLGRPRGARAVGQAMRECPADIPWHRVVNAQGRISPRARASGMLTQRIRLEHEGVIFERGRVPLSRYQYDAAAQPWRSSSSREGRRASKGSPSLPRLVTPLRD